jgi:ribose 5-phosphate isomerase B
MKIALSADHAGFGYKDQIAAVLRAQGHEIIDFGTHDATPVDYPDYGFVVGEAVAQGRCERGIVVCGSSIGIAIAANKVEGIRCAAVFEPLSCELSRRHNDANVLALSERLTGWEMIERLVGIFLETPFDGGPQSRHARRVAKLAFGPVERAKALRDLEHGSVTDATTPQALLHEGPVAAAINSKWIAPLNTILEQAVLGALGAVVAGFLLRGYLPATITIMCWLAAAFAVLRGFFVAFAAYRTGSAWLGAVALAALVASGFVAGYLGADVKLDYLIALLVLRFGSGIVTVVLGSAGLVLKSQRR